MTHVGILAVHGSSFSVFASILRAGPAISEHRAPIHGRYAGNTYPCPLGDSWWWSPGFGSYDLIKSGLGQFWALSALSAVICAGAYRKGRL